MQHTTDNKHCNDGRVPCTRTRAAAQQHEQQWQSHMKNWLMPTSKPCHGPTRANPQAAKAQAHAHGPNSPPATELPHIQAPTMAPGRHKSDCSIDLPVPPCWPLARATPLLLFTYTRNHKRIYTAMILYLYRYRGAETHDAQARTQHHSPGTLYMHTSRSPARPALQYSTLQ